MLCPSLTYPKPRQTKYMSWRIIQPKKNDVSIITEMWMSECCCPRGLRSQLRYLRWLPGKWSYFQDWLPDQKRYSKTQPVYLLSMLATSLLFYSLRSTTGITLSVHRVESRPSQVKGNFTINPSPKFTIVLHLFRANSRCLSVQVQASQDTLLWLFRSSTQHIRWLVDVIELLHRTCCSTLINASQYWARLCRRYWHHANINNNG